MNEQHWCVIPFSITKFTDESPMWFDSREDAQKAAEELVEVEGVTAYILKCYSSVIPAKFVVVHHD